MKKILFLVILLGCIMSLGIVSYAAEYNDPATGAMLIYTESGGEITITDCNLDASGVLTIPASIDSKPVTSIGQFAFSSCIYLTEVKIPDSVTNIGMNAFSSCTSLTELIIPNDLTSIAEYTFAGSGLTEITIPNSVTNIGGWAFDSCTNLSNVYCGDDSVANSAPIFQAYTTVNTKEFQATFFSNGGYGYGEHTYQLVSTGENVTAPTENPVRDGYTFNEWHIGPNTATFPDTITDNFIYDATWTLKTYEIAYNNMDNAINIGNAPTTYNIETSNILLGIPTKEGFTFDGWFTDSAFNHGTSGVTQGTTGDITFYAKWVFSNVAIDSGIVAGNLQTTIESMGVSDPTTITELHVSGGGAFNDADIAYINTLVNLEILDVDTSVTVGDVGDSFCSSEDTTNFDNLEEVTFPATTFGESAFYYCVSLTDVNLPNATTLGYEPLNGCEELINVSLPKATTLGSYAFYGCIELVSISLPEVTTFGGCAFWYCSNLESISLLEVTEFGDDETFYESAGLETLVLGSTIPTGSFWDGLNTDREVKVPSSSVAIVYDNADTSEAGKWKGFSIVAPADCDVVYYSNGATGGSVPVDATSPYILDATVTVLENTNSLVKKGYEITSWNTDADGSGIGFDANGLDTFVIRGDAEFYAQWSPVNLAGSVSILGVAKYGNELTADVSEINNTGTLSYQWKRGTANIGTNSNKYTVVETDIAQSITVEVTSDVQTNDLISAGVTPTVAEQNTPTTPTMASNTSTSIMLNAVTGCEYSSDDSSWQSELLFDGLSENTSYTLYQRLKSTSTHNASDSSSASFSTLAKIVSSIEITREPITTDYIAGEILDLTGIVVKINYDDSTSAIKNKDEVTSSIANGETLAVSDGGNITITYGGQTDAFTIAVVARVDAQTPSITTNLTDYSGTRGDTITLNAASTVTDTGTISYQWYSCDNVNKANPQTLGTNTTLDITQAGETFYYCTVTNTNTSVNGTQIVLVDTNVAKITISAPAFTGTVTFSNVSPVFGETVTANITDDNSDTDNFSYQWYRDTSAIANATNNTYIIVVDDITEYIKVEVSADDCIGIKEGTTWVVQKADAIITPQPVTTASAITYNEVVVVMQNGVEFACVLDGAILNTNTLWQTSTSFTGLAPETDYDLYARAKETGTHKVSNSTTKADIRTTQAPPNAFLGSLTIDGNAIYGEILTASVSQTTNNLGTLTYKWKADGIDIADATSNTFVITEDEIGSTIAVEVSDSDTGSGVRDGIIESLVTATVDKQTLSTPTAPTKQSSTTSNIILSPTSGYEYKIDGGTWQSSNVFSSLTSSTSYTFSQRVQGTNTTYESQESVAATISTTTQSSGGGGSSSSSRSSSKSVEGAVTISNSEKGDNIAITVKQENIEVIFSGESFGDLKNNNVQVEIEEVDKKDLNLPTELEKQIGDLPIFDISIYVDGKKEHFESDKPIIIEIPVDTDLQNHKIVAVYVDDEGSTKIMEGVLVDRVMRFTTYHLSNYALMYVDKTFDDIANHWGKEAVEALASREIINGKSEDIFDPSGEITRAEFATLMVRYFELSSDTQENYTDVDDDKWYADNIAIAKSNDILPNIYGDTFEPNKAITREEMMYILHKAMIVNWEKLDDTGITLDNFIDSDSIAEYALESAKYLVSRDIIHGNNNMVNPTGSSTRAEVAQMIYNMFIKPNIK